MLQWFRAHRGAGIFILRIFLGIRLIYGVLDNILSWAHMKKFETFLGQFNFPFPLLSAIISVYAQAIAGVLFILGWKTRWAALLMLINFIIALLMVHKGQSFEEMTTVLFMIVSSAVLLFTGAGAWGIDKE